MVLSFLSLNLWADSHKKEERIGKTMKLLENNQADIICLQQVSYNAFVSLMKQEWIKKYSISSIKEIRERRCFELILSHLPISNSISFPLQHSPSKHHMTIADVHVPCNDPENKFGEKLIVLTSEFDQFVHHQANRRHRLFRPNQAIR